MLPSYISRGLILRAGEVAIFLIAVVGAIALGLGITDYFAEHPYVLAYLVAYAGFRFSDLLVRDDPEDVSDELAADTQAGLDYQVELSRRISVQLPLLAMFAAAPFERTYVYGGTAPSWSAGLGLLIELLGLWLALSARFQLGFFTPGRAVGRPVLVRSGFYRHLRHPIYAGTFLVALGWPLEYGAPVTEIATLILGGYLAYRRLKAEEQVLLVRFGVEYETYQRETDALIPSIW
jgi:protein-S-isoprenylcysteine O-methyltransferase Ste14